MRILSRFLCLVLLVAACGGDPDAGPVAPLTMRSQAPVATSEEASGQVTEFVAGPLGAVEVAPGEEIQIRSLNAITGDVAFQGIPGQRGVELAIADYGPVAGRSVSLGTPLDDLCSPDGGQAGAQTVVADPSVMGVIGTTCSSAAVAASPLISNAGLVMISPINASPALTPDLAGTPGTAYQPGYYRTAFNGLVQGWAVASFVRNELGLNRAAVRCWSGSRTSAAARAWLMRVLGDATVHGQQRTTTARLRIEPLFTGYVCLPE